LAGSGAEIRQDVVWQANGEQELQGESVASASRDIAISFCAWPIRLSRYEVALWRQLAQTLFTLRALKRR
jgi:hypothetical protein